MGFMSEISEEIGWKDGWKNGITEYSNKLFNVIESATVDCRFNFNLDDLHNLEVVIKGLAEEMIEQKK